MDRCVKGDKTLRQNARRWNGWKQKRRDLESSSSTATGRRRRNISISSKPSREQRWLMLDSIHNSLGIPYAICRPRLWKLYWPCTFFSTADYDSLGSNITPWNRSQAMLYYFVPAACINHCHCHCRSLSNTPYSWLLHPDESTSSRVEWNFEREAEKQQESFSYRLIDTNRY